MIALIAGLLRLGFLASFISEPVLKGFIIGLALTIIVGQLPKLFGVEKGDGDFFEQLWDLLTRARRHDWRRSLVGLLSLGPSSSECGGSQPLIPGSLAAVGFGIAAVDVFDLDDHGVAIVGHIDGGLPSLGLPDAVLASTSSSELRVRRDARGLRRGPRRRQDLRRPQFHYEIDPNRELIGLGAANIASGLSSGMVVNGSLSKTAVNAARARSRSCRALSSPPSPS